MSGRHDSAGARHSILSTIAPAWDLSLEGERDTHRLLAREAISLDRLHVLASEILVTFASPSRAFWIGGTVPWRKVR
jgi:hypothetical protein